MKKEYDFTKAKRGAAKDWLELRPCWVLLIRVEAHFGDGEFGSLDTEGAGSG
jgi:hypothetical protein